MLNKTPAEIAAHLNNLYHTAYGEKARGRFVLSSASLRKLAGRARLEGSVITRISEALVEEYGLVLIHTKEFFGVEQQSALQKWREVPKGMLSKEGRRKAVKNTDAQRSSAVIADLNPANAWPFPVKTQRKKLSY